MKRIPFRAAILAASLSVPAVRAQVATSPQSSQLHPALTPQAQDAQPASARQTADSSASIYLSVGPDLIPLEKQSLTLRTMHTRGGQNKTYFTVPNPRSPVRVPGTVVLVATGSLPLEERGHPIVITPLKSVQGERVAPSTAFSNINALHTDLGKGAFRVAPTDTLAPGEYMVTIESQGDLKDGDEVFLFGVD